MSFRTAHEMFEHALIRRSRGLDSIYVKCPRCGRVGRLISYSKNFLGQKYRVIHSLKTNEGCTFSPIAEGHEYLDRIYNEYKASEPEREMCEFKAYLYMMGYSQRTIWELVSIVKKILREYGEFKDTKELREFLREITDYPRHKIYKYCYAYKTYLRFKQWKSQQQEKIYP